MSFKILKDQVVNVLNMTYVGIFRREGIKQSVSDTDYSWFVVVYLGKKWYTLQLVLLQILVASG